jgi:integrase/recombinase XerD
MDAAAARHQFDNTIRPGRALSAFARARGRWARNAAETDAVILDAFATYERAKNLSSNTIRNRLSILTTLQRTISCPLTAATTQNLREYVGREGIKAGSRRTNRNAIAAFYAFLVEDGIRSDNPAERLPAVECAKGEPRPFTWEQIELMLTSGAYRKTRAMILLGYFKGFRVSSIARVHGSDIDHVTHTIRTVGKGGKERRLPLHPMIAELALTMPADDWWFPARGERSGPINGSSVTNLITRAKKRAGITDPLLTPHSLRHAFGTDLVDGGVDIRIIQELMMHASLATTQIYTGVSAQQKTEAIAKLPLRALPSHSGRGAADSPIAA